MNRKTSVVAAFCAAMMSSITAPSSAAPDKDRLMISVIIDSAYNHHFQVVIPVTINKHFDIGSDNGDVRNRISGIVYRPIGGKYVANMYISEKTNRGINIGGSQNYRLELNKPVGWGIASSTASTRVVKLTRSSS